MLNYMLDTNIASYLIRNYPVEVRARMAMVPIETVCVSSITEAELRYGARRKSQSSALTQSVNTFLSMIRIEPWNSLAASQYAEQRVQLELKGQTLGSFDLMIAAHAKSLGLILVSNDRALLALDSQEVQNWVGPEN